VIWLFLGALGLVLVAMSVVAARTRRPTIPVDADRSWARLGEFYRRRPRRASEVDLGRDWRSEVDAGAGFTLSWTAETRELVAFRYPAEPIMASYGGGIVSAFPTPWGTRSATGLKVLARVDLDELRALPLEELRASADGLDRLTAAIGAPYLPPDPTRPRSSTGAGRHGGGVDDLGLDPDRGRDLDRAADGPGPPPVHVVTVVLRDPAVRSAVGEPRVTASGGTVADALAEVAGRTGSTDPFLTDDGTLRDGLRIYLGHPDRTREPQQYTDDLHTPLTDGATVVIESG
jgi:hypothetical protein